VVVLLIGTNNLPRIAEDQIHTVAQGIQGIVTIIRKALPSTTILLNEVLPRSDVGVKVRGYVTILNSLMDKWYREAVSHNRKERRYVQYLKCGEMFLNTSLTPTGGLRGGGRSRISGKGSFNISVNTSLMPDKLHPNAAGMKMWLEDCILPAAMNVINSKGSARM
jgi:lysophospholipase L1-like esterase